MCSANSFGDIFKITLIGESHGKCVGVVMDGIPAGFKIDMKDLNDEMTRRRPGQSHITTSRQEDDAVTIISGIFNGKTTGAPLTILTWNKDVDSSKYEKYKDIPRPGHADYPARVRYGGFNDYRGSGRFSGRLTAGIVMAGAIAKQIIKRFLKIEVGAHVRSIGPVTYAGNVTMDDLKEKTESNIVRCYDQDIAKNMIKAIEDVKKQEDSLGGIVECIVIGLPPGIGNPRFDNMQSKISAMMFSLGAVKAIEFGAGFKVATMKGSENNDPYMFSDDGVLKILSNNAGGILGGISTGENIIFRLAIKPTSSIRKEQKSVDYQEKTNVVLKYEGRHDPCIVPRIVPVVENATYIVLFDFLLKAGLIPMVLK
ncbi:MAG: chorismate synthase [Promethearchaeota archaeon]